MPVDGHSGAIVDFQDAQRYANAVLLVDSNGDALVIGGAGGTSSTDDAAFTAGASSLTPVGGIVTSDSVDAGDAGAFAMLANRQQKVTLYDSGGSELAVGGGTQYTEDAAAAANPIGNAIILVRDDSRGGSLTTTDGDNVAARGTNAGELYVKHVDAIPVTDNGGALTVDGTVAVTHAALTELAAAIDTEVQVDVVGALPEGDNNIGNVDVLSVVPGTGATNLGKAVDSAAGATDTGVVPLAVRDDSLSTLTPVEGDYVPLRVNSTGALHVTGGGGGTEYTVDDAAPAAPTGATFVMERDDALSALTEVEGDWTNPRASANGALWVAVDGTVTVASHAVTNAGTFVVQEDGAALTALQVIDDWDESDRAKVNPIVGQAGVAAGAGAVGATVQRVTLASDDPGVALLGTIDADTGGILTAVQTLDNPVLVDDAAFTPATSSVMMAGFQADEASTDSVDEGDAGAARMTLTRKLIVTPQPHTAGGLSIFRSLDIDESEEEVKATAGVLYSIAAFNRTAAPLYLKFYNATAANVTVGSTTPVLTFVVPGNADSDGAGFILEKTYGWTFDTAISVACTTGVADADTGAPGANDCVINLGYL